MKYKMNLFVFFLRKFKIIKKCESFDDFYLPNLFSSFFQSGSLSLNNDFSDISLGCSAQKLLLFSSNESLPILFLNLNQYKWNI